MFIALSYRQAVELPQKETETTAEEEQEADEMLEDLESKK